MKPTRPIVRYHGGKWRLAPWLIEHLPPHRVYVEPFGGAASVLMRKQPSPVEVYNDLNDDLVTTFRVLRDRQQANLLAELLRLTPCAESEFRACYAPTNDPVERARRFITRGHQGHGSTGASGGKKTGWRRGVREHGPTTSREWAAIWEHVLSWSDRLRSVYVEHDDACTVMQRWDDPDALHYVDPPYLAETRTTGSGLDGYAHEMSDADHCRLADFLHTLRGAVVLSGYASPLYDRLYTGWRTLDRRHVADKAQIRTERIWIKPSSASSGQQIITGIALDR